MTDEDYAAFLLTLTCSPNMQLAERARDILAKGFDPAEMRDEHGRWSVSAAITHAVMKIGSSKVTLRAHGGGRTSITDEHGHTLHLEKTDVEPGGRNRFRHFAFHAPTQAEKVGDRDWMTKATTNNGRPSLSITAGLHTTHLAEDNEDEDAHLNDRHTLHIAPGAGVDDPDELFAQPGTQITTGELGHLADTLRAMSDTATHVETGHGPLTTHVVGADYTLAPGDHTQIVLTRAELRKVDRALAAAYTAHDPADEHETGAGLSAAEAFSRTIPTKRGAVVVMRTGPDSDLVIKSDGATVQVAPRSYFDVAAQLNLMLEVGPDLRHLTPAGPDGTGPGPAVIKGFDPAEQRDDHGRWSLLEAVEHAVDQVGRDTAGHERNPKSDKLKLAGRMRLEPGEHLVGSAKIDANGHSGGGTVHLAGVERDGQRSLRIGVGNNDFGSRTSPTGPWLGEPHDIAAINAEHARTRAEMADLERRRDETTDPAERARVESHLERLEDETAETVEAFPNGDTAHLEPAQAKQLRDAITSSVARAEEAEKIANAHYDEWDRLESERGALRRVVDWQGKPRKWTPEEDARWDDLTARIEALKARGRPDRAPDAQNNFTLSEGVVPGRWGDVHHRVEFDDPSFPPEVHLAVVPHGQNPDDAHWASLLPADAKQLASHIDALT